MQTCVYVSVTENNSGESCGNPVEFNSEFCHRCSRKPTVRNGIQKYPYFRHIARELLLVSMSNKLKFWSKKYGFVLIYKSGIFYLHRKNKVPSENDIKNALEFGILVD